MAFLLTMHEASHPDEVGGLSMLCIEQIEDKSAELRELFYRAVEGKAVQS